MTACVTLYGVPPLPSSPLLSPTGWGDPARRHGLPGHALAWLRDTLGDAAPSVAVPPSPARSMAPAPLVEALRTALGAAAVSTDDATRLERAAGRSYLDLLALRSGGVVAAPDVVALPDGAAQVAAVLQVAGEHGAVVVPFGGGTSVVGGLRPDVAGARSVVSLDLRRMDRLLVVDPLSLTGTFEPGVRGPAAEALLAPHGLTLGHFPQSYEYASLGGYAATRSAGQASTGYGRFDELVTAMSVQTPAGELVLGRGAASAAGPDLRALLLGSEGAFGVITSVTVKVRRLPAVQRFDGVFFRSWADGCAALRELEQQGVAPVVSRLSDPDETAVQLALAGTGGVKGRAGRAGLRLRGYGGGCLAILGWEGTAVGVKAARRASLAVARGHGALVVGESVGRRWESGRYDGPYLRDDLLDAGYLVETLETSATWTRLEATRDAVRTAVLHELDRATVMCHVSHLYPHGASLYFTVLAAQSTDDPGGQWRRAKATATQAIVDAGATLTHHHAVGADHRDWLPEEIGPLGVEVLRAVKRTLDPDGILNPGTLLPSATGA